MRMFIQVTKEEKGGETFLCQNPEITITSGLEEQRAKMHQIQEWFTLQEVINIGCWFVLFLFNGMIALQSVVFC